MISNILLIFLNEIGLLSIFISVYGLLHLPLIDFRAYHEGANIIEQMNDGKAAQIDYFYLMQKGPTEELIPASQYTQYAADNWEMKNYQERIINPEIKPSIEDFSIKSTISSSNLLLLIAI